MFAILAGPAARAQKPAVTLGIDVLLGERIDLVAKKRVGLVTNPSGVGGNLVATLDLLARDPRLKLVQLYGPEHGIRGSEAAGGAVADAVDPVTKIPVQSLYGKTRRPTPETLAALDVLVFDIQDIGSRTYTFTSTMAECMKAAKDAGKPFVVLDRPNPLGGLLFEGPVREEKYASFIGYGPTPVSHGMTMGELARFFNEEMGIGCNLVVVAMKGWKRSMVWEDTGLDWVQTSPHIPHALNAHLYITTGMIAGLSKNVNEGVGYTLPFETIAAEWIDRDALVAAIDGEKLPGLRVRPLSYTPTYGKFSGKLLHGIQLIPSDLRQFRPLRTTITIMTVLERLYPRRAEYEGDQSTGRHWGNLRVLEMVRAGRSAAEIEASWQAELATFAAKRAKALLYD